MNDDILLERFISASYRSLLFLVFSDLIFPTPKAYSLIRQSIGHNYQLVTPSGLQHSTKMGLDPTVDHFVEVEDERAFVRAISY